jgi:hypothetical protein
MSTQNELAVVFVFQEMIEENENSTQKLFPNFCQSQEIDTQNFGFSGAIFTNIEKC